VRMVQPHVSGAAAAAAAAAGRAAPGLGQHASS
jgi:hypothetical protein